MSSSLTDHLARMQTWPLETGVHQPGFKLSGLSQGFEVEGLKMSFEVGSCICHLFSFIFKRIRHIAWQGDWPRLQIRGFCGFTSSQLSLTTLGSFVAARDHCWLSSWARHIAFKCLSHQVQAVANGKIKTLQDVETKNVFSEIFRHYCSCKRNPYSK